MLSPTEIKAKQILFINLLEGKENHLKLQNDNLILIQDEKIANKTSIHRLVAVFIIGDFTFTSKIIDKLLSFGISVFFLKKNLKCYASIEAKAEGNFLVRQRQYTIDDIFELELAQKIVTQKIENQTKLLKSAKTSQDVLGQIKTFQIQIAKTTHFQELMGVEGSVSKLFFGNYFNQNSQIQWLRRLPQTKNDIPNLLLDIGYNYLFNFVDSLLRLYGFDTYKGFYHRLFFERKSLSCDVMEVFRYIVDKALLKAYNLKQIDEKDFKLKNYIYILDYQKSAKYSKIFLTEIVDNRVEILTYIQGFYRYFMRPDKYDFPKIKFRV